MKILFIACYSPMINNSASIETLMYLNNLCSIDNNEIHLITVDFPITSIYYDKEVYKLLDKRVIVHAISGGKLFEKIMPKKINNDEAIKVTNNKISLVRRIKNKVIFPDMYYYWSFKAYRYAKKLMCKENFDVIFSMHEPPSSHLCALKLKKKFKSIPWILYWSDPWLQDPSRENIGFIRKAIEGNMEKNVVKNGDRHIFVTEGNRKEFISKYGIKDENTFIITRGYDKNSYNEIKNYKKPNLLKENKINIVYTGEIFSKLRDVKPFIEALNILKEKNFKLYNKMNILFFGNIDDPTIKEKLQVIDIVKVNDRINYKEALSYMIHSDVLLVFGNKNSKQIPAKIYDYFGTDNPIMIILGDKNDPIINITTNIDKCIICENTSEIISKSLINLIYDIEENKSFQPCEEYEWGNISSRLNNILSLKNIN